MDSCTMSSNKEPSCVLACSAPAARLGRRLVDPVVQDRAAIRVHSCHGLPHGKRLEVYERSHFVRITRGPDAAFQKRTRIACIGAAHKQFQLVRHVPEQVPNLLLQMCNARSSVQPVEFKPSTVRTAALEAEGCYIQLEGPAVIHIAVLRGLCQY